MHTPYTLDALGEFIAAQTGAALLLSALLLFARLSRASRAVLLLGVWLTALSIGIGPTMAVVGIKPGPNVLRDALALSAVCATLGAAFSLRPVVSVVSLLAQVPLWLAVGYLKDSELELSALHLLWLGVVVGLLLRRPRIQAIEPRRDDVERSYLVHDAVVFALATVLAGLVSVYVMDRRDGSADEWAYTFQAAIFAKGHVTSAAPRCEQYLDTYYVFENLGRMFSQYTPGWSLFMVPFVWLRQIWLSGPFSMGLMVWGMARLGRSAMRTCTGGDEPPSATAIRAAGTWAAVLAMLGTTILINGGSRYAHVFVVGLYAWSLEGMLMVSTPGLTPARQVRWGVVLGLASSMMLATRPADGAFLGLGMAVAFLYLLARRRVGWRALAGGAASFALLSAVILVILRLQLGRWFTTGYSLLSVNYPWQVIKHSVPQPNEWKYGLPLATGTYCWWPCSLPLGLAGLITLRGRAGTAAVAMAVGCATYMAYLTSLELGRGFDWGYGPRYAMVLLVPMAIGGAVVLARLTVAARSHRPGARTALARGGPLALAILAVAGTWLRITPLLWQPVAEHTHQHGALQRAAEQAHLRNAIVLATPGTTSFSDLDLPTNLPVDLYPEQEILLAIDKSNPREAAACLRSAFPGRKLYSASGVGEVRIAPFTY